MNKIYKLKYDRRRNQLVAVSELTTGAGKEATGSVAGLSGLQGVSTFRRLLGTLTPLAVLTGLVIGMLPGLALANPDLPVGGQVVAGQGSISTSGNQMTIHQGTHGLVTNWNSFDIGQNHTVQFVQPDSSAVALNRVTGGHESQILGTLTANGQVMLVNPAGVMFGKGAKVNTAGLLASTKNISAEDFMAGRYTFSGGGHPGAEIVNQGSLTTTKGGYIVLAADRVRNSGTLSTPSGKTVLAAADRVTLQLDNTGLASVSVNGSVVNALVENSGLIAATNGQVYLTAHGKDMLLNTVVNNSGTVEARGLNQQGGEIVLDGGDSGVVSQSGMLLADSEIGRGGKITLQGANIHLAGGSRTSATGRTGGGEVYVGGGWQGKDSRIRNASKVVMDKSATIDVSATESGNGGSAVLWSEDYTNFHGTILAKGGAQSGNGGQVETSSHNNLQAFGDVDASALNGQGGNWLLDPTDVTVVGTGADTGVNSATVDNLNIFTPTASGAKILNTTISNSLDNGSSVTVKTSGTDTSGQKGNITISAGIRKAKGGDATLTFLADGNISTPDGKWNTPEFVNSTSGRLNLTMLAGDGGTITLGDFFKASLNGGDFTAGVNNSSGETNPGAVYVTNKNAGYIKAGNITIDALNGYKGYNPSLTAAGNLTINGSYITVNTGWNLTAAFTAGDTLKLDAAAGDISFTATDTSHGGGRVVLSGDKGVSLSTSKGGITLQAADASTNSVNISSANGSVNINGNGGTVSFVNANVTAHDDLNISADSGRPVGINFDNSALTAMNMNITGVSTPGGISSENSDYGGIAIYRSVNFTVGNKGFIHGVNNKSYGRGARVAGIRFGRLWGAATITTFNGNFDITGKAQSGTGGGDDGAGLYYSGSTRTNIINGNVNLSAIGSGAFEGSSGVANAYKPDGAAYTFVLDNANLSLSASSDWASAINEVSDSGLTSGYVFSGKGDVSVNAHNSGSATLQVSEFDNTALDGHFLIDATNDSGNAILVTGRANSNLVNATIHGHSGGGGKGVVIAASPATLQVNLGNNTITGDSVSGTGIEISGKNVSITNGTLSGTATSGNGVGVRLSGGSNYTLDGANITGHAVNGSGVIVAGSLTVNNGTSVAGQATGSGSGIRVSGNLNTGKGDGITLNGTASAGDGVVVAGNTMLMNATLQGHTDSGAGVNIAGNLTADNATQIQGNATGKGAGVILGASLTGATVSGVSGQGVGLQLADKAVVTNASLKGESTDGSGVAVTGNISLDDTTASGLSAGSVSGAGLSLENNANVSIFSITTVTQAKTDQEGHAVTDESGNPVMETITSTNPVTSPVHFTGISQKGSGVATSGNVSISGVVLNGSATMAEGKGATLGGHLTIADNISGVNVSASGNGTALVLNNATVNAIGYNKAGQNFILNVSTDGDGSAIRTTGDNTLTSVELSGSAKGNGSAVVINGILSTDKDISVVSSGDKGTGLELSGGTLVNTQADNKPMNVTVSAAGNGTAVQVTSGGDSSLNNITLNTVADKGSTLNVAGNLTSNVNLTVSTVNGTALILGGGKIESADSKAPVTVNALATGDNGTAVYVTKDHLSSISSITLNASSTGGDAVNIEGILETQNTDITANATGKGTALNVNGGTLKSAGSTVVNATASNGHSAVINDGKLAGSSVGALTVKASTTSDSPALEIGGISDISNSVVGGENSGNGSAVNMSGVVTSSGGGEIKGQTINGTAVEIQEGTSATSTQEGGIVISATVSGEQGVGVALTSATLTGSQINVDAVQGNAVTITDGSVTGGNIAGHATSGVGLNISNATLTNASLSGTTQTGQGAVIAGSLTSDDKSVVSGGATQDGGAGVNISGSITGGKVDGHATSGNAVTVSEGASASDTAVTGEAQSGTGV
ncbi:filamentous hemagglutinin N-terminal domain-containing protein, partial [Salmonella enterica]|nr:filamentous hemagglutinin N-terminal domain-containing protein [Salmonella enterica]